MAEGVMYDVVANLRVAGAGSVHSELGKVSSSADALQGAFDKSRGGAESLKAGLSGLGSLAADATGKILALGAAAFTVGERS